MTIQELSEQMKALDDAASILRALSFPATDIGRYGCILVSRVIGHLKVAKVEAARSLELKLTDSRFCEACRTWSETPTHVTDFGKLCDACNDDLYPVLDMDGLEEGE